MISFELLNKIQQFINNEISVQELEEWTVPRIHLLLVPAESDEADLVATIELGLAEISEGIIEVEDLRETLTDRLREPIFVTPQGFSEFDQWNSTGTSSTNYSENIAYIDNALLVRS